MARTKIEIICASRTFCDDVMSTMNNIGFTHIKEVFNRLADVVADLDYNNSDDLEQKIARLVLENEKKITQISYGTRLYRPFK